MKKNSFILLLSLCGCLVLPAVSRFSVPREAWGRDVKGLSSDSYGKKKSQDLWNYWSVGFATGLAWLSDASWVTGRRGGLPHPDFRFSVEKSLHLSDNVTLAFDISPCTPTMRLGSVIGERFRLSLGVGLPIILMWGREFSDKTGEGTALIKSARNEGCFIKSTIPVTPSISLDYAITKNSFLRVTASYDQLTSTRLENRKKRHLIHWPACMLSLNMRF